MDVFSIFILCVAIFWSVLLTDRYLFKLLYSMQSNGKFRYLLCRVCVCVCV